MRGGAQRLMALLSAVALVAGCASIHPSTSSSIQPAALQDPPQLQNVRRLLDSALVLQSRGRFVQAQALLTGALSDLSVVDTARDGEAVRQLTLQVLGSMRNSLPYSLEPDALEDAVYEEEDGEALLDSIPDTTAATLDSTSLEALRQEILVDSASTFDLPIEVNDRVLMNLRLLKDRIPQHFARWLERKGRWEAMIDRELSQSGLPRDLVYQAMIESGFNPRATSPAAAAGIWQFIPATGRRFGLRIDRFVDERRDPVKSTRAAIGYLSVLYQQFGDWKLAMAAYNCGEYCVERTIRRAGHSDYWTLPLPRETKNYVPRIFAAAILGKNPKAHGFDLVPWAEVVADTFTVEGGLTFDQVGKALSVDPDTLALLNPALVRGTTPPAHESWVLNIPQGSREKFALAYPDLDRSFQAPAPQRSVHKVRRKETLAGIAARYGVSVADLKRWNKISGKKVRAGRTLVVYGDYPGAPMGLSKEPPLAKRGDGIPAKSKQTSHRIRRGESLAAIAKRYGVTTQQLEDWNGLSGGRLKPGKYLWVSAPGEGLTPKVATTKPAIESKVVQAASKPAPVQEPATGTTHRVRRGETLEAVASKYGTTAENLRKWNHLASDRLRSGSRLRVAAPEPAAVAEDARPRTKPSIAAPAAPVVAKVAPPQARTLREAMSGNVHVVRDGETLDEIARKYGVSSGSLRLLNHLRSSRIDIGQRLALPPGAMLSRGSAEPAPRPVRNSTAPRTVAYTVRPGDSLYSIARSRSTTVDTLMQLNGLKHPNLKPGQVIQVPMVASL